MSVSQCLYELWVESRESNATAFVQTAIDRTQLSYTEVYQWKSSLQQALNGDSQRLVVGINLIPFSIEETVAMLLVAEQRRWIYVPIDMEISINQQLSILQSAGINRLVTTATSQLFRYFSCAIETKTIVTVSSPFESVEVLDVFKRKPIDRDTPEVGMTQRLYAEENNLPLYVLYTSGTTGKPRGVVGTRIGAWTRLMWMWKTYPFATLSNSILSSERVLRATKLSFVDSIWEILGAFIKRVPIVHFQSLQSPPKVESSWYLKSVLLDTSARILDLIHREKVTRLTAVPSVLEMLLVQSIAKNHVFALSSLCYILSSGEPLRLPFFLQLTKYLPDVVVLNLYGSTEISGDVTCMKLKGPFTRTQLTLWQQYGIPIGKLDSCGVIGSSTSLLLLPNKLDQNALAATDNSHESLWPQHDFRKIFHSTCTSAKGMLYVSGSLVSLGYIADARKEESFVEIHATRWFCTGDVCCVVNDELFFCGRKDQAVKIHGQRVYLEAVECAVARGLQDMANNASRREPFSVIALKMTMNQGKKYALLRQRIVACIIDDHLESLSIVREPQIRVLTTWIATHYGTPHSPQDIFRISKHAVPRLAHGKIDRRALELKILEFSSHQELKLSSTINEKSFAEVHLAKSLRNVLGISFSTCVTDDMRMQTFADLGGNSLVVTLFQHELNQIFETRTLFDHHVLKMTMNELLIILESECSRKSNYNSRKQKNERQDVLQSSTTDAFGYIDSKRRKRNEFTRNDIIDTSTESHLETLHFLTRCNHSSKRFQDSPLLTSYVPSSLPKSASVQASSCLSLEFAWRVNLSKCIDASPLVVQRYDSNSTAMFTWAIIGSHSRQLVCIDVLNAGQEKWRVILDDRIEASAALCRKHKIVYVGTYSGSFYALDLYTGNVRWQFQAKESIKASAVVIDQENLVLCGAYDQNLYALNAIDGHLHWVYPLQGSMFASPFYCVWTKQLFVATTKGIVECLVVSTCDQIKSHWKLQLPAPVFAGLNIDNESNTLLIGCADGKLYGANTSTGHIQWQVTTDKPIFSSPCVYAHGLAVFGSHDGFLRKIKCRTGELVWASNLSGALFASPTVFQLVAGDRKGKEATDCGDVVCCVAMTTGRLCFCDEKTGSIFYETSSLSGKAGSNVDMNETLGPLFGSPVIVDTFCLIGTRTNYFVAFNLALTNW
ncbi:hypothetical protein CCR75_004418 [Bremia lactucae]|uniref:Carrier domain-containing protein n=1 Tax=Bremia lactucae TaxID=4779 RepID=A0A976IGV6_BRELC|nr:hypothetical protein CCR75_004418 [Bremia lactucae]